MIKQPNYNKKPLKRKHQKNLFDKVKNKENFIGLCGPTPGGYLKVIASAGFKNVTLVDSDANNLTNSVRIYNKSTINKKITLSFFLGNINSILERKAFYDLDYCCNINSLKPYLSKIMELEEFTLTVSLRGPIEASEDDVIKALSPYGRIPCQRKYGGGPGKQAMMMFYFPPIK